MNQADLVIFGGGNMARAIAYGALQANFLQPSQISVCDSDPDKHSWFRERGIRITLSHAEALHNGSQQARILLAVKPQMLALLAEQLSGVLTTDQTVISILAGASANRIRERLRVLNVIRVMPNLAASIRLAMSAIADNPGISTNDLRFTEQLFSSIGQVVHIREDLMDAFTAIAGSGPAYLFYLAEAMVKAAEQTGFSTAQSRLMVSQTLVGAAVLLERDASDSQPRGPLALRQAVTSKDGTTEAAANSLESAGVLEAFVAAILKARDRSRQLDA